MEFFISHEIPHLGPQAAGVVDLVQRNALCGEEQKITTQASPTDDAFSLLLYVTTVSMVVTINQQESVKEPKSADH